MKQLLSAVLLLLAAAASAQETTFTIVKSDLTEANCQNAHPVTVRNDNEDLVIKLACGSPTEANTLKQKVKLCKEGSEDAIISPVADGSNVVLKLVTPMQGIDGGQVYLLKKDGKCVYKLSVSIESGSRAAAVADDHKGSSGISRKELHDIAEKYQYQINLQDLVPAQADCCKDDTAPACDCDKLNMIKYDAKCNRLTEVVYGKNGKHKLTQTGQGRALRVVAGTPLTFRVINLNDEAYKIEISDTSDAFFQTSTSLLDNFFNAPSTRAAGTGVVSQQDRVRAGLFVLAENISGFLYQLQYSCLNHHYNIINAKIAARKRVDTYLEGLGKNKAELPEAFMLRSMDMNSDDDTALYHTVKGLYASLVTTSYNLESFIPEVPRDKDVVRYKLSIKAREKTPYLDKVNAKEIRVYIVHNWKVDVSSGFYYAGNMNTQNYTSLPAYDTFKSMAGTDSVVTGKRFIKDKSDKGEFGFNSLVHYSYKFTPSFAAGFHLGAGVSLNDKVTPRYFAGGSMLFGNERGRLNVNFGMVCGNVKEISNKYAPGIDNASQFVNASDNIETVNRFTTSWYVGLSYNLPFGFSSRTADASSGDAEKDH